MALFASPQAEAGAPGPEADEAVRPDRALSRKMSSALREQVTVLETDWFLVIASRKYEKEAAKADRKSVV